MRLQLGVSMLITLIALLLLMIGAVAMVRAFGTSSMLAGNLAFRRDLTNEGELAMQAARQLFQSGALNSDTAREASAPAANYSATRLATNAQGIPLLLVKDSLFAGSGMSGARDIVDTSKGVSMRYVIDRQCTSAGAFSESACMSTHDGGDAGGSNWLKKPGGIARPVYRVTVRITGPRATQAYLQTTLTY